MFVLVIGVTIGISVFVVLFTVGGYFVCQRTKRYFISYSYIPGYQASPYMYTVHVRTLCMRPLYLNSLDRFRVEPVISDEDEDSEDMPALPPDPGKVVPGHNNLAEGKDHLLPTSPDHR